MKEIVSVAVISFNSSGTILETLDSIVNQTYGAENLELIISDDCSTDDTVKTISAWLALNEKRFKFVNFTQQKVNGGVSENCNAAWKACTSSWIKTIAADDILRENCIVIYTNFIKNNPKTKIVFALLQTFRKNLDGELFKSIVFPSQNSDFCFFSTLDSKKQLAHLYREMGIPCTPTAFILKDVLESVDFSDIKYKSIEDYPLWIKLLKRGETFRFTNEITVDYRVGESASSSDSYLCNRKYIKELIMINESLDKSQVSLPLKFFIFDNTVRLKILLLISLIFNNKKSISSQIILKLIPYFTLLPFIRFFLKKFKIRGSCF